MGSRDQFLVDAYDAGLLVLGCGAHSVRVRPHLDVRREALDEALNIMEAVLPRS